MEKVTVSDFTLTAKLEWICPDCKMYNIEECNVSPYRQFSEDLPDVMCKVCKKFFILELN